MKNNFNYKWSKLFASKRYDTKDGIINLTVEEQQELLNDSEKLVSKNESLHLFSCSDINCEYEDRGSYLFCEKHGTAHKKRHCN